MLVDQLLKSQKEHNIDGYVMYGRAFGAEEQLEKVYKINTKIGFLIHKFKFHIFGKNGFYSLNETKRTLKLIDKIKPDVIHLHNIHGYYINIEMLFKYLKEKKIPIVWTFHDCWPFTGHCTYFSAIECEKWKTGCFACPQKTKGPRSLIFDRSKESYTAKKNLFTNIQNMRIITVSNWLNDLVKESFLKDSPTTTIYNWIDRNVFNENKKNDLLRKRYNIKNKFVILGVAPAWVERKGINDFLALAKMISEDEIIVLVGDMLKNKIFGEKPVKDIPENIIVIPPTKNANELASIYAMADVFINPSRQETFGLTTAEAMSCGTPVIVYDTTACPEVVGRDGKCGFVAKSLEVEDLYSKIQLIKGNAEFNYSGNSIERVCKLFNKTQNLDKYIQIYYELASNKDKK